jgi:peroxiredoxin
MKQIILVLLISIPALDIFGQSNNSMVKKNNYINMDSLYKACIGYEYKPIIDINTIDGKRLTNNSFEGKVTFINFWFEMCWPCRAEFGKLNELFDSVKNDSDILFISITFDSLQTLRGFIKKAGIHYPVATTNSKLKSRQLNYSMGFPSSIIIDRKGRIAFIAEKAISDEESEYKANIHRVLAIMRKMKTEYAKIP